MKQTEKHRLVLLLKYHILDVGKMVDKLKGGFIDKEDYEETKEKIEALNGRLHNIK